MLAPILFLNHTWQCFKLSMCNFLLLVQQKKRLNYERILALFTTISLVFSPSRLDFSCVRYCWGTIF